MRRQRSGRTGGTPIQQSDGRRRSEAGDTLIEILIALTVIGIAGVAILLAFATSISGSSDHRNLTTMDAMLRTAAAEVTAAIQQQPSSEFATCLGAYTVNNTPGGGIPLPTAGYTATIYSAQYWTGTGWTSPVAPTNTGCPNTPPNTVDVVGTVPNTYPLGPQQLTVQVTYEGTPNYITTVVQDPAAPPSGTGCGDNGKGTQLVWVAQPAGGLAGSPLAPAPTVVLENASGCVEQQDASTVQLSIASGPSGGTLSNCSSFPGNGETTFEDCSLSAIGTYTLQASDPTDGILPVPSNPFVITAGIPAKLVFHEQPVSGTAGTAFATTGQPIVVWIEDSSGNVLTGDNNTVTLAIGTNPSGGTLSGCGTTTASNGVATFTGCTINAAGNGYTLKATDGVDSLTSTSNAFNIAKASPTIATALSASSVTAGQTAYDTATLTGASTSTGAGTVTYSYYTNNTCSTGAVAVNTVTVPVSGIVPNSNAATVGSVGTYYWQAVYSGDANNNAASSPCTAGNNEKLTVTIASPTISTTLSAATIAVGQTAHDTSTLTGAGTSTGTATVAYSYYTNNTCTTAKVAVNTVTVPASGVVPNSSAPTFNSVGTYYWQAVYSGDTNNNAASSPCTAGNNEQLTVTIASPSISTTLSAASITVGQTAHDTSTLTGAGPSTGTATVAYSYYTNNTCTTAKVAVNTVTVPASGIVPNSNAPTFNSVATYYWQAVYSGDTNNNAASSPCTAGNNEQLTVKYSPTIATTLSAASITAGSTAHDAATLTGAVNSTGTATVAYSYYTNNTCSTGAVAVNTVTVSTGSVVPNSNAATFNSAGTYYWQAVYSGDANNNAASSPCTAGNNEQLTVTKASPTIATALSAASITAGQTAYDTSTLSGAGTSTGAATVTYSYYTNNTCSTGAVAVNTVTVPVSGIVPNSNAATFGSVGTYYWQAVYSGDANNNAASSPCTAGNNEKLTVTIASPTISTTLSAATIAVGQTAHDTSTLTGAGTSTGTATVAYSYYTNNTCTTAKVAVNTVTVPVSGIVPNSNAPTFGSVGTYYWQAVYSGDTNNTAASSPCTAGNNEQLTVTIASPTIATTLSAASITVGQTAHDTSTLTGAGPSTGTATVAYSYYTNNTCSTGAVAVNTVTVPASGIVPNSNAPTFNSAGTYYWQAVYSGDANNNAASSPCTAGNNEQLTVTKASPTIATALSAASITAGQTAYDTSTLSGAGTSTGAATVTYSYYTNNTCSTGAVAVNTVTVPVSGIVPNSNAPTFNSAGTYYWQAVYSGDANNNGASSPCTFFNNEQLTVTKASPTIATALSAASILAGTTAYDTSTLTGAGTSTGAGTVTYSYYTNNTCTAGHITVGAVTVPVSGIVPNSNAATFGSVGTYYWQAVYSGDANNNAASSLCTAGTNEKLTVTIASPTIATALSAASITAGSTAHDSSTLTGAGTSTGTATVAYSYYTNNTCSTGAVAVNTVTVPVSGVVPNSNAPTFGSVGTYYWQAVYSGDTNNTAASSPCTAGNNEQLTVTIASPTIATALSAASITAGSTAHDSATLTGAGTSTGTATVAYSYYTNNTCSTGAVAVNTVTVPASGIVPNSNAPTFNSAGTYFWQAVYSGDANNNAASSPCTASGNEQLTVTQASPTIATTLSAASITAGSTAHDTATLTGAVNSTGTATVAYSYYTNNTCSTGAVAVNTVTVSTGSVVPNSNAATFNSAGTYYWQAVYSGDANNNAASSPCTAGTNEKLTVTQASPTIATALSAASITAGQTAYDTSTLTGAVNSTGTATVTYSYYTNNTCSTGAVAVNTVTVPVSGIVPNSNAATFGSVGTYYWQAVYSGDANNNAASSLCTAGTNEKLTVTIASPTIATALSAASITAGTTVYDTSTLTGAGTSTGTATVAYSYYTNNTCRRPVAVNTVTVPVSGVVPNSNAPTFGSVGTYYWQAVYSGDTNNTAASSPCTAGTNEQLTVTIASPTISTTLSAASITAGSTAHDSATLTGAGTSTGTATVAYSYYTNNTCSTGAVAVNTVTVPASGIVPNSNAATFNSAGTYFWQAVYSGDANNNAASSPCTASGNEQLTVTQASPTIATTLSAASITAGSTAHDTATLTGAVNSTGTATVAYSYYTNNTCSTGAVAVNTVTVSTGSVVPNSNAATFGSVGTYYWQAVYSGDANNNAASSPCTAGTNEKLTVTIASPTIATALSAASITAGQTAYDTSTLTGAGTSTGAGTVTYSYYTNNTCTAGHITVGAVTVPVSGIVPNSNAATFGSVGTYYWQAVYSGDANNNAASSLCTAGTNEKLTVTIASPTIATALSAASITAGSTAHDSSTLTGAGTSTGTATVAYSYYTNNTCSTGAVAVNTVTVPVSGVVPNSNAPTFGSVGTYYWQAVYSGDTNNTAASSPCTAGNNEQLTVTIASPTIATTLSAASITAGSTAHDSATLTGAGTSTGTATVAYSYYTNNTCSTGAVAVNTVTVPASGIVPNSNAPTFNSAGTYFWQAVYSGDANNNAASSPCTASGNEQLTVTQASPTIATTLSAASITAGSTAHDTATLTGAVNSTGTATVAYSYYTNNTCSTGAVAVNTVTVSTGSVVPNSNAATFNSAGTYYWQAVYSGDANNNAVSSPCTAGTNEKLTVTQASPTIATALSAASITAGQTAYDTSTLTGAVNSTGTATVTYSYYTNNTCSTGAVAVNTVTVPVSGVVPNSNAATFGSVGTYYWQAVYSGDANNNAASSLCTAGTNEKLTVTIASPTIATALSASSVTAGTAVYDTSTLTGAGTSTGTATVAYSYYTNNTCTTAKVAVNTVTVPVSGVVPNSNAPTFGSVGTYYWQAVYSGDTNNTAASSPCTAGTNEQLTVTIASPSISTTLSAASITAGQTAYDTSTLTGAGTSTGTATVAYSYYTNNTCTTAKVAVNTVTVPASGIVPNSSAPTFNSAGTYFWQAVYSGDANNNAASSVCTVSGNEQLTVNKASPTIATTLSAASITAGSTAYDTSTLTGAVNSSGMAGVTYSYYTNNTCSTGAVAVNTVTVSTGSVVPNSNAATFGSVGTYYWQAVYSGDANNNAASSPCTAGTNEKLTVTIASPTIATALSAASITAGQTAYDTSTLTGAGTSTGAGTVTYSYYTNNTCTAGHITVGAVTVPVSGIVPNSNAATFGSVGTYYWQAVYSGDANNNAASSLCTAGTNEKLTVTIASPTIATALSASSVTAGTAVYDTSTLTGAGTSTGTATVAYSYYTNNTCTTAKVAVNTVTVPVSGVVPNSNAPTFGSVGTYYWQAVYSGDTNNTAASSPCTAGTNEQLTVTIASPSISTTLSAASITAGQTAYDTSTLTGAGTSTGTATVAYSYYTNNTCTTAKVAVNTVTVPASGIVPNSSAPTFNSAGTYFWQAVYSGDANNNAASSVCTVSGNEQLTVNKAIAFVQQQTLNVATSGAAVNSVPLTLPNTITTGDALVLVIADQSQNTSTVSGVTETGATWAKAQSTGSTADGDAEIWYALNVPSSASKTITVALTGITNVQIANVSEYSGVATTSALDQKTSNTGSGTGSAPVSAGSVTPSEGGELIVSDAYLSNGTATQPAPSNGFTALTQSAGTSGNYKGYGAYLVDGASSSISTTWTGPNNGAYVWSAAVASFEP